MTNSRSLSFSSMLVGSKKYSNYLSKNVKHVTDQQQSVLIFLMCNNVIGFWHQIQTFTICNTKYTNTSIQCDFLAKTANFRKSRNLPCAYCLKITYNIAFDFFFNLWIFHQFLSGNTVRKQALGFQKKNRNKWTIFGTFD